MNIRFNQIYYVLGYGCNMNCKYCAEHLSKDGVIPQRECGPEAEAFIRKILRDEEMSNRRKPVKLTFYGGEPLIYWDDLVKVHQKFVNEPMADPYVFSNLKALTQDIVDYLNKYNFQVILGWDGRNTKISRGYDVMKPNRDLILQLNRIAFNGIGTKYNYPLDFVEDMDAFDKDYYKIHGHHIQSSFSIVEDEGYNVDNLIDIDIEKWRAQSRELAKRALDVGETEGYSTANKVFRKDMNRWSHSKEINVARCGCGTTIPVLDGAGNLYLCQNSKTIIGHVTDNYLDVMAKAIHMDPVYDVYRSLCKDCSVVNLCRCGCKMLVPGSREKFYCELTKGLYEPWLEELEARGLRKPEKSCQ